MFKTDLQTAVWNIINDNKVTHRLTLEKNNIIRLVVQP